MHILTKIFVVLVSVLSIGIVPLVVVQSVNEDTFKNKFLVEQTTAAVLRGNLDSERSLNAQVKTGLETAKAELETRIAQIAADIVTKEARIISVESEKADLAVRKAELDAHLGVLTETDRSRTELVKTLNDEVSRLRDRLVGAEKARVDMEARAAELEAKFEVADEARKQLQEEIARRGSNAAAGTGEAEVAGTVARVLADRNLRAKLTRVTEVRGRFLAQIDHGSKDGVQPGWMLTVAQQDGKSYVGDLIIDRVDVDKSVGHIEWLPGSRTPQPAVVAGQIATARKGY